MSGQERGALGNADLLISKAYVAGEWIGGAGEQKTLRLVARHADIWHSFVKPDVVTHKLGILEEWAQKEQRDLSNLTVSNEIGAREVDEVEALYTAGVRLFTLGLDGPDWNFEAVRRWIAWRDAKNAG